MPYEVLTDCLPAGTHVGHILQLEGIYCKAASLGPDRCLVNKHFFFLESGLQNVINITGKKNAMHDLKAKDYHDVGQ